MESNEPSKDATPSAKSMQELMKLLSRLGDKLREKIPPLKGKNGEERLDIMIVILTSQDGKARSATRSAKRPRPANTGPSRRNWIQDLCRDIERGSPPGKKP